MNIQKSSSGGFDVFEEWTLYDRVIHFNYMRHREMAEVIRSSATKRDQPLRVLDLGCGDGRLAFEGLRDCIIDSYLGVDLSSAALDAARGNLASLSGPVTLRECNLETALDACFDPSPNFILASYSLHHFQREAINGLLAKIAKNSAAGGVFLWIDLQRQESETRDHYLERFCHQQLAGWDALSDSQIQEVIEHMRTADFPLTGSEKRQLAASAGLQWASTNYHDAEYSADLFRCDSTEDAGR